MDWHVIIAESTWKFGYKNLHLGNFLRFNLSSQVNIA